MKKHTPLFTLGRGRGLAGLGALALAIFIADLRMPNGLIDGFLYVLVVIWWQRIGLPRSPATVAALLMPLMLIGFLGSPTQVPEWIALTNRAVAMLTIWIAAYAVARSVRGHYPQEGTAAGPQQDAGTRETVSEDWIERSGRVVRDVDLELKMLEWRLGRLKRASAGPGDLKTEALLIERAVQRARLSLSAMSLPLHHDSAR